MKTFRVNLRTIAVIFVSIVILGILSCKQKPGKQKAVDGEKKANRSEKVHILYPIWSEGIALTNLAKAILEDKGYQVKLTLLEPGKIYSTLAKSEAELMLDAWLPHTHSEYWKKYNDNLRKIGEAFSQCTSGLVVPTYVDIDSITQLNKHIEMFNGKIVGINSNAGIHRNTEKAIKGYNLDFNQITSNEVAMMANLKSSYESQEPFIITGWKPHTMWADFDLKYLEDPKEVYPKDVCAIVSRQGFEQDFPVLYDFFTNFNLQETQLYNLMDAIEKGEDELEAARGWYNDHTVLVESWMPEEMN